LIKINKKLVESRMPEIFVYLASLFVGVMAGVIVFKVISIINGYLLKYINFGWYGAIFFLEMLIICGAVGFVFYCCCLLFDSILSRRYHNQK